MRKRTPTVPMSHAIAVGLAVGAVYLGWAFPALPHDAPMGWSYDYSCCSTNDCREVKTKAVKEDSRGFTIVATGELIPYGDSRIKRSKDEFFHWCSVAGLEDSRSLCLYVPDRGI